MTNENDIEPLDAEMEGWTTGVDPDPLLNVLVGLLESDQLAGMPITVNVSGQVITGQMVSRARWFSVVVAAASEGDAQAILAQLRDDFSRSMPDEQDDFLHLEDARLVSSDHVGSERGAHWRCKVGAVSSWAWGSPSL